MHAASEIEQDPKPDHPEAKKPQRKGGLAHLMGKAKEQAQASARKIEDISLDDIVVLDGFNPRKVFDPVALDTLADSIASKGILAPLLVREMAGGVYHLIDGERRLRSSRLARERGHAINAVPCIVFRGGIEEREALYMALATGHNERLGPFEEAGVFVRLRDEGVSVEEISQHTGYAESFVFERLRLDTMPEPVKVAVAAGEISLNQAKKMHQESEGDHEAMLRALDVAKGKKPKRGRPPGSKNKAKAPEQPAAAPQTGSAPESVISQPAVSARPSGQVQPPANCRNCAPHGFNPTFEQCQVCELTQGQPPSSEKPETGPRPKGARAALKVLEKEFDKSVEKLAGLIEFSGLESDLRKMRERLAPALALVRKTLAEDLDTEVSLAVRKYESMIQGMALLLRTTMRDGK